MTFVGLRGVLLKTTKPESGDSLTFLCPRRGFPKPGSHIILVNSLPDDKKLRWAARILEIPHSDSTPLPGVRMREWAPWFLTDVYLRARGESNVTPVVHQASSPFYAPQLLECGRNVPNWLTIALPALEPRKCHKMDLSSDRILYAVAATYTAIVSFVEMVPIITLSYHLSRWFQFLWAIRDPGAIGLESCIGRADFSDWR